MDHQVMIMVENHLFHGLSLLTELKSYSRYDKEMKWNEKKGTQLLKC